MFVENHLHKYRKKFLYTQSELAYVLGCSQNTISDIENYKHEPSLLLALKICDVFHCNIEEMFCINGCGYSVFLEGIKK